MKSLDKVCFICGNNTLINLTNHYMKCTRCGHEVIKDHERQSFIINDILSIENIKRFGLIDKFKQNVLKKCTVKNDFLLDIGSGSGKFLYHSKSLFKSCMGIEVTDSCIDFAKNCMGLKIEKDISNVNNVISIATFWHSLEHIPLENIERLLNSINYKSSFDTRVIVSIPNNNSFQYMLFGDRFAYYDPSSHIHQFSIKSLNKIMEKYGFEKECNFYSFPYAIFGYLQGFMNIFNNIHNYLYYRKKRGDTFNKGRVELLFYDVYSFLLLMLFVIPSLLFSILDYILIEKGGVITACYRKRKN